MNEIISDNLISHRQARAAIRSGKVVHERHTQMGFSPGRWRAIKTIPLGAQHLCGYEWRLKPGEKPARNAATAPTYIGRAAALLREARMILSDSRTACPAKWQQETDELLKQIGK